MENTYAQDETKKSGRPKGPIDIGYHVLLLEGEGSFEHLTKNHPVKAKSRKGALEALGASLDGSQSFLILKDTDFKLVTPRTETQMIERSKFVL